MNFFRRRALPALLLSLSVAMGGCNRKAGTDRDVWAEVNGKAIRRQDVEKYYHSRMSANRDGGNAEQNLSFKLNILDELINNQVLMDHALHSGITVSEAEVDQKVSQLQSPYSKEEFQKKLQDEGVGMDDLRREVRESLIIDHLISKEITSKITVTEAEIARYYEQNKASFNVPETEYHLAQIAVTPVRDPQVRNLKNDDAKDAVSAERKIRALYARLRAGDDFALLAEQYSEDPRTVSSGGDMGFVPASALRSNPQLQQAVTALRPNQISGIILAPDGYHIIKLLERQEPGQRTLSNPQVQSTIRRALINEKDQLLKAAYIETLRNQAKVVNELAQRIVAAGGNANGIE